jgi:hypothetical protein
VSLGEIQLNFEESRSLATATGGFLFFQLT